MHKSAIFEKAWQDFENISRYFRENVEEIRWTFRKCRKF